MNTVVMARTEGRFGPDAAMRVAAQFWFVVAIAGQWIFASYLIAAYGGGLVEGNLAKWNAAMSKAYVQGDAIGNTAVALHLLLGFLVMSAGALQLVPQVRARFPTFHRWNGRVYLTAVAIACLAGLYMTWGRSSGMGMPVKVGATTSAALMLLFGTLALRAVLNKDIRSHRRWALRLFMTASAAWFFRILLMVWLIINGGEPVGLDTQTGRGPFLDIMAFGQYLIPLALLELYFRVQDRPGPKAKWATAATLGSLTIVMGAGIAAATVGLWLPHFQSALA